MIAIFTTTMEAFMAWLSAHQHIAYIVLFLGAYFETLIGTGFFIPGEIFLVSGALLGGAHVLNILLVTASLFIGAALGDNTSYFIGKRTGPSLFKEGRLVMNMDNYRKGETFFKHYGNKAIFLARIMGPFSWITPFLAGVYKVHYRTFFIYNVLGISIGVGQFMVAGYFFGEQYKVLLKYSAYLILIGIIAYIPYFLWKRKNKRISPK
jgi:membrane-associated protein